MLRSIYHRANARISVGVDIDEDGIVRAAIAACHRNDEFTRRRANDMLNGRLNSAEEFIELGVYIGDRPHRDIFAPIRDIFREIKGRRSVESLISLIMNNKYANLISPLVEV